ncbi:bifunctional DNA primase/polymerase [Candidatus Latescibacterota bacterium]
MTRKTFLEYAEEYTKHGWHVFRIGFKSKSPLKGTHGFKDATLEQSKILKWFSENGKVNIGIRTGEISGLVVVDIDKDKNKKIDGFKSIKALGGLTDTYTVKTKRGKQFYYKYPANEDKIGCTKNLGECGGIDLRGDDGYVVAPPSLHPDGIFYKVEKDLPLAELPESIIHLYQNRPQRKKKRKKSKEKSREIPQNNENFVILPYNLREGMALHNLSGPQVLIYLYMRGKCGWADKGKYLITTQFECPYSYITKDLGYDGTTISAALKALIKKGFLKKVLKGGSING